MANIKQLKHLEHLEDELLNHGVEGCKMIVEHFLEVKGLLGCAGSDVGYLQTKWDGAPSVVCGTDPITGIFFVGTKSVFNKVNPKPCASARGIDELYADEKPGLAVKLKACLKYFKNLGISGVIQGDLLWTEGDLKTETIDKERILTFKPNTIAYGIPVDHKEISDRAIRAKVGVVFHTHYTGASMEEMQAKPGVDITKFKNTQDIFVVDNDTETDKVGLSHSEEKVFDDIVSKIDKECKACGDFLDYLVTHGSNTGNPKGDDKYHIAPYIKKFFNDEIRKSSVTPNIDTTLRNLILFYHSKMDATVSKIKTSKTKTEKRKLIKETEKYLASNEKKFKSLIALYKEIQNLKQVVIDKLDPLEKFRTYILKDGRYEVTSPEGYVLHRSGDMVKFVNRLEFSKNNFIGGSYSK